MVTFIPEELQENKSLIEERLIIRDVLPSLFATIVVCQLAFLQGVTIGYSAILLPQLEKPSSTIPLLNINQASWIAGFVALCRPIGAFVVGVIADKYGRKTTIQITSLLMSASWLLTYFSQNIILLYFSRIVQGFTLGMVICIGLYIVEISAPSHRGTLLSLFTPIEMGGTLFVYVLGYLFTWETTALILCVYSLMILALTLLIPESHIWYMNKFRKIEAVKALIWFRNNKVRTVENEILKIEDRIRCEQNEINYLDNFKDPAVRKPFLTMLVFGIIQQQVGYFVILYYAVDFFSSFEMKYDPNMLSIIFAAISFITSSLLVTVMHKFDRKTLMFVSGLGMTFSMLVGAIFLSVESLKSLNTVPVYCVFIYILFCMLGLIELPWLMVGEMFPYRVRSTMSANVLAISFVFAFFCVKFYPFLNNVLGVAGMFWYFSAFSLLTVIYCQVWFPETRGKSLFQIEDEFRK